MTDVSKEDLERILAAIDKNQLAFDGLSRKFRKWTTPNWIGIFTVWFLRPILREMFDLLNQNDRYFKMLNSGKLS